MFFVPACSWKPKGNSNGMLTHLKPEQIRHHTAHGIFKYVSLNTMFRFCLKFHWNMFLVFGWWWVSINELIQIMALCWQATSHYLNWYRPRTMMPCQCLPFYIINEVGHLTTSVDHLAEFCQNYHLAAICTQLMVKFFLQLRFIQYFDCKCMKIPDFSRIDSHFVA